MRNPMKKVAPGKDNALSRPPSGELTCNESEVEDRLSAGESTEEEPLHPQRPIEQKPSSRNVKK